MDIVIRSEEEAWEYLQKALKSELVIPNEPLTLRFDGWPNLDLKFTGKDFDSSVPTRLMPALLDAQKEIHRLYARVQYGEENLRRLTGEDRERLELVVKVKKGSSEYETNLQEVLTEAFNRAIDKMDSLHLLILILGLAVSWGSVVAWKAWLKSREKIKEIDSRVLMSQAEEQKLTVLANALNRNEELRSLASGVDEFRNASLSKLKLTDKFTIPTTNLTVDGERAATVTTTDRSQSNEVEIIDRFIILSVDSGGMRGYRIKVRSVDGEQAFSVSIPDEAFDRQILNVIKDGEWDKRPVQLTVSARILRGQVSAANLIDAVKVETA